MALSLSITSLEELVCRRLLNGSNRLQPAHHFEHLPMSLSGVPSKGLDFMGFVQCTSRGNESLLAWWGWQAFLL